MIRKGFTLIELLVVMAVLGVLAAGLVVAINPMDKIRLANDTRIQNDVGQIASAAQGLATANNGGYPATLLELEPNELVAVPKPPTGTSATGVAYIDPYGWAAETAAGAACTTTLANCARIRVWNRLTASKYSAKTYWVYCSSTGKTGATTGTTEALCP